jgi:hypothetical protein
VSPRHRLAAFALLAAGLAVAAAAILPAAAALLGLADENAAMAARIAHFRSTRPDEAFLSARLAALEASARDGARWITAGDEDKARGRLAAIIAMIEEGHGVEEVLSRPLGSAADGTLAAVRLEVTAEMAADRLEPFLIAIEAAVPALFVDELRVVRRDEREGLIEATVAIRAYAELKPDGKAP